MELLASIDKIPDYVFYQLMHLSYIELIRLVYEPATSMEGLKQVIETIYFVSSVRFS